MNKKLEELIDAVNEFSGYQTKKHTPLSRDGNQTLNEFVGWYAQQK